MIGIIGIVASLTVFGLSLIITRLATVALAMTGLSREAARFQARSAFTGTGFTTTEAEKVVNHPVRRRIIMSLMLLRSAGIITIILSLILSFASVEDRDGRLFYLVLLATGAAGLLLIARSKWLDQWMANILQVALHRWTDLDTRDYASLLNLSGDYMIVELHVSEEDWLAGRTLKDCKLPDEGITILGIYRQSGDYIGVPQGTTKIHPDETILLYGRRDALQNLNLRPKGKAGDRAHHAAIENQDRDVAEQNRRDQEYERQRSTEQAISPEGGSEHA